MSLAKSALELCKWHADIARIHIGQSLQDFFDGLLRFLLTGVL